MTTSTRLSWIAMMAPVMLCCAEQGAAVRRGGPAPQGQQGTEAAEERRNEAADVQQDRVDEIQETCNRKADTAIPQCWSQEYERTKDRKLESQITLMIVVGPSGQAQQVKVTGRTGGTKELEDCVVNEARSWNYPEGTAAAPAVYCSFYLKSSM